MVTMTDQPADTVVTPPSASAPSRAARRWLRALSFRNASALYVFAASFLIFSLWVPETFLTVTTWKSLLNQQSITALAAVALCLPLAAGVFDLSIGATVGAGSMVASWLLSAHGVPAAQVVVLTLAVGACIGLFNGFLVTVVEIDSFIATLGVSSVLTSIVLALSGGSQIIGLSSTFQKIATSQLFGLTLPVYYLLGVSLAVWYLLEQTPSGRRFYATGGNREAARLAGVRTSRIIVVSLVACSVVASFAGLLVAAGLGTGDPTVGPDYLLPAFSAAFLGSTQFRSGRFNVWGTVVSVYVLAVGTKGLQLAGAPFWIPYLFNGVALIAAVALTTNWWRDVGRRLRRRPKA